MNEHTYRGTDKRKDENYIPLGINAGGIIRPVAGQDSSSEIALSLSEAFKNLIFIYTKHDSNQSKALQKLTP